MQGNTKKTPGPKRDFFIHGTLRIHETALPRAPPDLNRPKERTLNSDVSKVIRLSCEGMFTYPFERWRLARIPERLNWGNGKPIMLQCSRCEKCSHTFEADEDRYWKCQNQQDDRSDRRQHFDEAASLALGWWDFHGTKKSEAINKRPNLLLFSSLTPENN